MRHKPFTLQLIIVGGFLIFMFIFFALTKSVYEDYKLQLDIDAFESAVNELEVLAQQKPQDVLYYQSLEYKDKYAKENLNLINPGERLIIIPQDEQVVKAEVVTGRLSRNNLLRMPNPIQWKEYFFGQTLLFDVRQRDAVPSGQGDEISPLSDRVQG